MFMRELLNYAYAVVFILGLLLFVDLTIRFKRPLVLKWLLLLMAFGISSYGLGHLYCHYNGYIRWVMEIPPIILFLSITNFLSLLYVNRISWIILLLSVLMILTQLSFNLYAAFGLSLGMDVNLYQHPTLGRLVSGIRLFFLLLVVIFNANILLGIRKKYHQDNIYYEGLRNWAYYILGIFFLSLLANFFKYSSPRSFEIGEFINMMAFGLSAISMIYRPDFLNRTPSRLSLLGHFTSREPDDISQDRFVMVFFNEMYYLREKASMQELAALMDTKPELLSQFIHRRFDMGFTDLVNKHRIQYFIELVKQGRARSHTIEALARQSGFSSRQNMQRFFKKFHGGAPSDLINMIEKVED